MRDQEAETDETDPGVETEDKRPNKEEKNTLNFDIVIASLVIQVRCTLMEIQSTAKIAAVF